MAKITSSPLVLIDQTDARNLEVQVTSNLPITQIYNKTTAVYSPSWVDTPLIMQAFIYLDAAHITSNTDLTIEWYKNSISSATKISSGSSITIKDGTLKNDTLEIQSNVLSTEPIITYICQVKYQNLTTNSRTTYTRVDSGEAGASAPAVQAQYSVNGTSNWTTALNATTHKYVRYSYDGGKTWTNAIKMVGEDGSSITVTSIQYQSGTSATTAPNGTWSNTVVAVPAGSYLWTKTIFSDNQIVYGVARQGADGAKGEKGDQGIQGDRGVGISSVTVTYGVSTSASTQPTSWQSTIPTVAEGSYLWTRTVTDYTDTSIADTVTLTYTKQGAKGDSGSPGTSVTVSKIEYQSGTSATTAPTGTWSTSVVTVAEGSYLWTKTTFSDGKVAYGVAKQGANGTSASLVDITPSALYFKSTTGKNGTFTPDYIYLYPRFQTVTFSKWEYSVNGDTTWIAASGADGLTISTYNSVANTLRISKTSTLYTDTVTSISFRCVSSNASVYDTISVAKLFDVDVEEINTRITNSLAEVKTTTDSITSRVSATETSIGTINNNISSMTNRLSTAEQKITPTAIVSTVRSSTDYTNDLGKKVGTNEIISKINQTAESVTISANKIGLLGSTNIPDLTADKIKGGTLTLGGSSATTQNGQILVKNASDTDMIAINQYGMAITDGNLMIVNNAEINDYGGWSSESHTKLKTTGIQSMYIAPNSTAEYHAELDAINGLTLKSLGGINANPYYFNIGPTEDDISDYGTEIKFYNNLILTDDTNNNMVANISANEVILPKTNIILQDTAQKNIQFQNASKELRSCMLYAGANDSTTVMGAWDTTKAKSIFTYSTDNKFYILDSEAVTKSMMQNSVGERGYQKLPSGFIIQWGYQGSALTVSGNYNLTTGNITLPIAFPNSFTGVFCQIIEVDSWNANNIASYYNINAKANGLTGFTWKTSNYWNNWGSSILFSWMAIGY